MKNCVVESCSEKHHGFGYCWKHYNRFKLYGDPFGKFNRPLAKGYVTDRGYVEISIPGKKHIKLHRYMMEKHLGRTLNRSEHIHHINGNKLDNRIENLEIVSQDLHNKHHQVSVLITNVGKECTKCHIFKIYSEYSPNKERKHGYITRCKSCSAEATKLYRLNKKRH